MIKKILTLEIYKDHVDQKTFIQLKLFGWFTLALWEYDAYGRGLN